MQNTVIKEKAIRQEWFSYYEYKYLVRDEKLEKVLEILDELCGGSDPFAKGIVDSIYYDTIHEQFYRQCLNGDSDKTKYRIRGYGNGCYSQIHQKTNVFQEFSK